MRALLQPGKLNIVMDGQFGSTGKGVISGYIAQNCGKPIDIAVTNAAPNAGHTVDFADGRGALITNHLPIAALWSNNCLIYLCAGSIINPKLLGEELEKFSIDPKRVLIHPRAAVIEEADVAFEKDKKSSVTKIASTQKGVGAAMARKIMRNTNVAGFCRDQFPEGVTFGEFDMNSHFRYNPETIVLMEVPQGYGLGINSGLEYPYTTCRDISVAQALSDAQTHPSHLGAVMMTLRTYPIRVGNIVDDKGKELGASGPFYPDSSEIEFSDIGVEAERTTVTKRIRRIATFSYSQYVAAVAANKPTHVFLNFCNYFLEVKQLQDLLVKIWETCPVTHLGVGPSTMDVIDIQGKTPHEAAGVAFNK